MCSMTSRHRFHASAAGACHRLASMAWPLNCGLALAAFVVVVTGQGLEEPTATPWDLDPGALSSFDFHDRGGVADNIVRQGLVWRP